MKKFWLLAIGLLLIKLAVLTIVVTIIDLWGFWAVPVAYGLAVLTTIERYGVEYWGMRRSAEKFGVDLEFFARVRYELKWDLPAIQLHEEVFRAELEKRKKKLEE